MEMKANKIIQHVVFSVVLPVSALVGILCVKAMCKYCDGSVYLLIAFILLVISIISGISVAVSNRNLLILSLLVNGIAAVVIHFVVPVYGMSVVYIVLYACCVQIAKNLSS